MVWFSRGGGAYSLKLASINTFLVNSQIAARYRGPQLSSDVTHHSGVFTAYYVRKRGFSGDRLPRFVTHVLSFRGKKKSSSQAVLQRKCVTGDDLFKHVLSLTQTLGKRGRDAEWDSVFMYVWAWEARGKLKASTGVIHFTQNHQLHPTSTTLWVCCFSAAAAQPAGEERRLFVVLQPKRWESFSTAYATCRFSFNRARALSITRVMYH